MHKSIVTESASKRRGPLDNADPRTVDGKITKQKHVAIKKEVETRKEEEPPKSPYPDYDIPEEPRDQKPPPAPAQSNSLPFSELERHTHPTARPPQNHPPAAAASIIPPETPPAAAQAPPTGSFAQFHKQANPPKRNSH